ncbi:hypothetical protein B0H14DRAFT_2628330 [Mycena olivaceomarginata]|nr:hypothetical protein B0H14DRAFT_2628330 [Mycena olivaceomarginata]
MPGEYIVEANILNFDGSQDAHDHPLRPVHLLASLGRQLEREMESGRGSEARTPPTYAPAAPRRFALPARIQYFSVAGVKQAKLENEPGRGISAGGSQPAATGHVYALIVGVREL